MKNKVTPGFVIGMIFCSLFAILCVLPLIYMVLMSFTQATTLKLHFSQINLLDFYNYWFALTKRGFAEGFKNSVIVVVTLFGRETSVEFELDQVEVMSQ